MCVFVTHFNFCYLLSTEYGASSDQAESYDDKYIFDDPVMKMEVLDDVTILRTQSFFTPPKVKSATRYPANKENEDDAAIIYNDFLNDHPPQSNESLGESPPRNLIKGDAASLKSGESPTAKISMGAKTSMGVATGVTSAPTIKATKRNRTVIKPTKTTLVSDMVAVQKELINDLKEMGKDVKLIADHLGKIANEIIKLGESKQ